MVWTAMDKFCSKHGQDWTHQKSRRNQTLRADSKFPILGIHILVCLRSNIRTKEHRCKRRVAVPKMICVHVRNSEKSEDACA